MFLPEIILPITYGLYSLEKNFLTLSKFLGSMIRQNPTPQLNVLNISLSVILFSLSQLNITDKEMLRTFNCGVGFCLIIDPKDLDKVKKFFSNEYKPYVIGKIISGKNKIKLNEKINWS